MVYSDDAPISFSEQEDFAEAIQVRPQRVEVAVRRGGRDHNIMSYFRGRQILLYVVLLA